MKPTDSHIVKVTLINPFTLISCCCCGNVPGRIQDKKGKDSDDEILNSAYFVWPTLRRYDESLGQGHHKYADDDDYYYYFGSYYWQPRTRMRFTLDGP